MPVKKALPPARPEYVLPPARFEFVLPAAQRFQPKTSLERAIVAAASVQAMHDVVGANFRDSQIKLEQAKQKRLGFFASMKMIASKIIGGEVYSTQQVLEFYSKQKDVRKDVRVLRKVVKSLGRQHATVSKAAESFSGVYIPQEYGELVQQEIESERERLASGLNEREGFKPRKAFIAGEIKGLRKEFRGVRWNLFKDRVAMKFKKPFYEISFKSAIAPEKVKKAWFTFLLAPFNPSVRLLQYSKTPSRVQRVQTRITNLREAGREVEYLTAVRQKMRVDYNKRISLLQQFGTAYKKASRGTLFKRKT